MNLECVVVHDGMFHLDDVIFCSLLNAARYILGGITKPLEVKRAPRDKVNMIITELENQHKIFIIGDIGGGTFDHHDQRVCRFPIDENATNKIQAKKMAEPYSASSKLWLAVGPMVLSERFVSLVDNQFFRALDMNDNFGSLNMEAFGNEKFVNPLSLVVSWMNIDPKDSTIQNNTFANLVEFFSGSMKQMILRYQNLQKIMVENNIEEIENNCEYGVVELDKFIDSKLFDSNKVKFVVEPAMTPGRWQIVSTNSDKHPIIERSKIQTINWAFAQELDEYDKNAEHKIFFHESGYLTNFPNKEWAMKVALMSIIQ